MSPEHRNDGGLPRSRGWVAPPPGSASREESWPGANEAKAEKLRLGKLKRQAGAQGLQLRHSDYGYALIDTARKPVDERNNLTLDEVQSQLDRAVQQ
ncbi:MAG: hypothetical protein WAL31_12370 [Gaiellaceae bacterium]